MDKHEDNRSKPDYSKMSAHERYQRDVDFHTLVDMIYMMIERAQYTPTELREAVILAATKYEQSHIRPLRVCYDEAMLRILYKELDMQRLDPQKVMSWLDGFKKEKT